MAKTWTGKRVRCTEAGGSTFETVAVSEPYPEDLLPPERVLGRMVIAIEAPYEPEGWVNWPLTDVELVPSDEGGDE